MPETNTHTKQLKLRIVTPAGPAADLFCASVRLDILPAKDGTGGGKFGIRPGHLPAMLSLGNGKVTAYSHSAALLLEKELQGGFATVADDVVTVLTSSITE